MSLCPVKVRAPFCVPAVGFEDCYGCISSRSMICARVPQDRPRVVPPPAPSRADVVFGPGDRCVQGRGCVEQLRAPEPPFGVGHSTISEKSSPCLGMGSILTHMVPDSAKWRIRAGGVLLFAASETPLNHPGDDFVGPIMLMPKD